MPDRFRRKQPIGQKIKGALRRVFALSVLGATLVGAPAYYAYGTTDTREVKIKAVQSNPIGHYRPKHEVAYNYKLVTDQGMVFENKNSLLHLKFNSKDIQDQLNAGRDAFASATRPHKLPFLLGPFSDDLFHDDFLFDNPVPAKPPGEDPANKVYRINYYGGRIDVPFIHTYPNVLSVEEVSPEELQARAAAAQDARAKTERAAHVTRQQASKVPPQENTVAPADPRVSKASLTFSTVVDGQRVTITSPIGAADKITVNKVTPVVFKGPSN